LFEKKLDFDNWYEMEKDQPKWKKSCDPTQIGLGLKRSNPNCVGQREEGEGGSERPKARKDPKRKSRQKANNTIV